jgi:hemerythrin-like domain-containing protein
MPENAIDHLTKEHREAEELMKKLKTGSGQGQAQVRDKLAEELQVHMRIEEEVLYPFMRRELPDGEKLMAEAEEEHQEARQALEQLLSTEPGSAEFEQALTTLEEGVNHHVQEEENEIFPKLRKTVDEATLVRLGEQLTSREDELKGESSGGSTEGKTRDELYAEAKEIGIEGRSKMNKDELADAVESES